MFGIIEIEYINNYLRLFYGLKGAYTMLLCKFVFLGERFNFFEFYDFYLFKEKKLVSVIDFSRLL